ncbi:MAG: hypothetical protein IT457_20540 [Planctomycetes bacterium]|nr:hypothetical protein [Planctomycetota bacterium]
MTRFEVPALLGAGAQVSMVSERTGVSAGSVQRIADEEPIEDPAEVDRQRAERMGRPSAVRAYAEQVGEWLPAAPELRSGQVLERLREAGYQGSKTAAYDLARRVRVAKPPDGVVRFEGMSGEFSQHDFGQVEVLSAATIRGNPAVTVAIGSDPARPRGGRSGRTCALRRRCSDSGCSRDRVGRNESPRAGPCPGAATLSGRRACER